jgi:asparagine synthase (glutamine-hydrolysing)
VALGSGGSAEWARRLAEVFRREDAPSEHVGGGTAILDQRSGNTHLYGPRVGLHQAFWSSSRDTLRVASIPPGAGAEEPTPALNPARFFDYVYFHSVPGPASVYSGVSKLAAGHHVEWDGGQPGVERYWRPAFQEDVNCDEREAARELRTLLKSAVERRLHGREAGAGAFLSGGLDSSSVAGFAAEISPGIPTVTMGFAAQGYDEMEYARLASRKFGTRALEYYVTPDDVLSTLPTIAGAFSEPFGNSSAAAVYHCARIAREAGLALLLAGDGGDEIFGGNERYAKQLVFERYGSIPRSLRRHAVEPALMAAGRVTRAFPIGKALSYVAQASVPLPDRLQAYNFLHRHDPAEVFSPALLEHVDQEAPLELLRREYQAPTADSAVNRMLFLDWKFTLQDNDLVKVNTMCHLLGLDVSYPMLDPALVDFSLRLPPDWKVRRNELRWFYKRAMKDLLPPEIIHKTKHGFGLPFGIWMAEHAGLRRLASDCLGSLAERGHFNRAFLRDTERLHREVHAKFYGELVWILVTLELWLRAKAPTARM